MTCQPCPSATNSPPSKCPGFFVPKKPRALPCSAGGERRAIWTLYCSTEEDAIRCLGPFVFLSQDELFPLVVEIHMMCPRARRTGRNPEEAEIGGTISPSKHLEKA